MKKAILGKKIGMTQIFAEDGRLLPVTVVEAGPCTVVQKKTADNDGYKALQVGFVELGETRGKKLLNKPELGHLKKAGVGHLRVLREFRLDDTDGYDVGSVINADIFSAGDIVDVSGTSKGKGTEGPIRRWNQHRGPMAHGSKYHRGPGAMSANTDPGRVFKNKKLAGRLGNEATTILNIEVVRVDPERNLMLLKGAIPGPSGSLVVIRNAVRKN